jgi:hypothetical protein
MFLSSAVVGSLEMSRFCSWEQIIELDFDSAVHVSGFGPFITSWRTSVRTKEYVQNSICCSMSPLKGGVGEVKQPHPYFLPLTTSGEKLKTAQSRIHFFAFYEIGDGVA